VGRTSAARLAAAAMPGRRALETEVLNALGCGLAGQDRRAASRLWAVTEVPALCPGALPWRLPRVISPVRLPPYAGNLPAEYLLYLTALSVLGRKYRSFNYARAR
jgi:hypothetical protein